MLIGILNLILSLLFFRSDFPAVSNPEVSFIKLNPAAETLELGSERSVVFSVDNRIFLFTKEADEVQPIASITKLMTSLVFLDNNPGWEKIYKISARDEVKGGRLNLYPGDSVKIKDLFHTSLVASDNGATLALVHATGLGENEFVSRMNEKAAVFGLSRTKFVDPIGLGDGNVSTAREVAILAQAAFRQEEISRATMKSEYVFLTVEGREKKIESTDYLLFDSDNSFEVLGGKTGYTDSAGYCFVSLLQSHDGRKVISVVLNSDGKNNRFRDAKKSARWALDSYIINNKK
jgi:D-alanyl-D-alanine endopeptidase (penicillin-binding protein 7)